MIETDESEQVSHESRLDLQVQFTVTSEARRLVHLKKVRIESFVYQHVEPKQLEAVAPMGHELSESSCHGAFDSMESLDYELLDPTEEHPVVNLVVLKNSFEGRERPLCALHLLFLVLPELLIAFVDGVVGQMRKTPVHGLLLDTLKLVRCLVSLSSKSHKALIVHVNAHRAYTGYRNVDAEVELQAINK